MPSSQECILPSERASFYLQKKALKVCRFNQEKRASVNRRRLHSAQCNCHCSELRVPIRRLHQSLPPDLTNLHRCGFPFLCFVAAEEKLPVCVLCRLCFRLFHFVWVSLVKKSNSLLHKELSAVLPLPKLNADDRPGRQLLEQR